jgi:hypothetical protein
VRRSLTVIRGEVELILGQPDAPPDDRRTSSASVIEEVERVDALLRHQRPLFRSGATAAEPMVDHPHVSGQTDLSQAEMRGHLGIRKG